jgi:hypothetical protein
MLNYMKLLLTLRPRRPLTLAFLLGVFFIVVGPFLLLVASRRAADNFQRELIYLSIINRIAPRQEEPIRRAEHLFDFIRLHVFMDPHYRPVYQTPLTPLLRGMGYCDQQSGLLVSLMRRCNMEGRVLALYLKGTSVSNHSVAEIKINGSWIMFDPSLSRIYVERSTNHLMSASDIHTRVLNGRSKDLVNIYVLSEKEGRDLFEGKYQILDSESKPWGAFYRQLQHFIDTPYRYFGAWYADLYQDTYFIFYDRSQRPDDLFRRAQLYALMGRRAKAAAVFDRLEAEPAFPLKAPALFWQSVNLYDWKQNQNSLIALEKCERYIERTHPYLGIDPHMIALYKGLNYLALNDSKKADRFFQFNEQSAHWRRWTGKTLTVPHLYAKMITKAL